jgi:hypothetical protein
MQAAIGWLRNQTFNGKQTSVTDWANQWRASHQKLAGLSKTEAMVAEKIAVTDITASMSKHALAVLEHPVTKQSFGVVPVSIKTVELAKLVVFQRTVNLTYAGQLQSALGPNATADDVFHFALPTDGRYDPPVNVGLVGGGPNSVTYAFVSPSNDLRALQPLVLDPTAVPGLDVNGRVQGLAGVAVGYGANYLSAMRVGPRLILKNGTHRAFALLAAGHTHAPMLIEEIPDGEEREHLPPDVLADPDAYLVAPRPPLLSDYLNDDLRVIALVPRTLRTIRVTLSYDEGGIPGV